MPNKVITFQYFVPRLQDLNTNEDNKLKIMVILKLIEERPLTERNFVIHGYICRLERIELIRNTANRYMYLRFMKISDSFTPNISYIDKESKQLDLKDDEYIGEDVNVLFDMSCNVLMIQNNNASMRTKSIEKYLTHFAQEDGKLNEYQNVNLLPIVDMKKTEALKNKSFRKLEVMFANLHEYTSDEVAPYSKLRSLLDTFQGFGCTTGTVTLSMGYSRNSFLNPDCMNEVIDDILVNRENIRKAKIIYMEDEKSEPYDLFENLLNDKIIFSLEEKTSLGYEYARDKMLEAYTNKLPKLLSIEF